MPAIGCEFVDAGVAVSVRDVKISLRGKCSVSAGMEGQITHQRCGFTRHANLHQQFSFRGASPDGMVAIVGTIQRAVRGNMKAMRVRKKSMTPGAQYIAFPVKHDHRVLAPGEEEYAIL